MRAVVVQHEEHEGPGSFGPALCAAGFELVPRFRQVRPADADAALFVVLGGTMAAFDTIAHPFLAAELAVLAERLARGRPCLGICLGAQLMARAAGACAYRGTRGTEIGACTVRWLAAAKQDPVLAPRTDTMVVAQWHQDTWSPVPGATHLATSDRYEQQGFRVGPSFAFQFHLELDGDTFRAWLTGAHGELQAAGHDPAALLASAAHMAADEPVRSALVARLAQHFAGCARRAAASPR